SGREAGQSELTDIVGGRRRSATESHRSISIPYLLRRDHAHPNQWAAVAVQHTAFDRSAAINSNVTNSDDASPDLDRLSKRNMAFLSNFNSPAPGRNARNLNAPVDIGRI